MNQYSKQNSPGPFRFVSGLGVIVIMIGLVDLFGNGDLVSKSLQFPGYELVMILLGIAMLLPSALYPLIPEQKYEVPKRVRHHRRHHDVV